MTMSKLGKGYKAIRAKPGGQVGDKAAVKFYCSGRGCRHGGEPELIPTAVCFYIKGSTCSHLDVKKRVEDLLPLCPGATISAIQFVPLAVHLDTVHAENRWVITLNSVNARNRLAGTAFHIKGHMVVLRRYDDIVQLEYRRCSKSTQVMNTVNQIKNLKPVD